MPDDEFVFKDAQRTQVLPLIGLFGKSGGGKTLTGLYVARGLVGPEGKIGLIDTESGRGNLYEDVVPGSYKVMPLEPPFSPLRYLAAVEAAEKAGMAALVVDSMTHEWAGEGGVLDMQEAELQRMAGEDWAKRERVKMASWIKPKADHKKFIQRLLRVKIPLIVCMRGEEKTHMEKGEGGGSKTKVVTDKFTTPICDPRFVFELLLCAEVFANEKGEGGFPAFTKVSHPLIWDALPKEGEQFGIEHGKALAKWCNGETRTKPAAPAKTSAPAAKVDPDFMLQISEASTPEELTRLAGESNGIAERKVMLAAKNAIMARAEALRYTWKQDKFVQS